MLQTPSKFTPMVVDGRKSVDVEVPEDVTGAGLAVGDTILFAVEKGGAGNAPCIRRGVIRAIDAPEHQGYGYWTRPLTVAWPNGSESKINYPRNVIKVRGAA